MDVRTRTGDKNEFHFGGGAGLIAAQLFAEGPITNKKSSFLLSARRTYADLYVPLFNIERVEDAKINFYDLNLKLDYDLSPKSNLQFNTYKGRDIYNPYPEFLMNYGNTVGSLHFKHRFGDNGFRLHLPFTVNMITKLVYKKMSIILIMNLISV